MFNQNCVILLRICNDFRNVVLILKYYCYYKEFVEITQKHFKLLLISKNYYKTTIIDKINSNEQYSDQKEYRKINKLFV